VLKKILLALSVSTILVANDEIEQLIKDITDLRYNYEICKGKLEKYKLSAMHEGDEDGAIYAQNIQLKNEVQRLKNENNNHRDLVKKYDSLTNQNIKLKDQIQDLLQISQTLRQELKNRNNIISSQTQAMKESKQSTPKIVKRTPKIEPTHAITYFDARPFRITKDADILDRPNGNVIERWSAMTSFTSNQKSQGYVKITGYFIDGKWLPSSQDMWVKESSTKKR
jgi:small-conductance mechanosensitive channel